MFGRAELAKQVSRVERDAGSGVVSPCVECDSYPSSRVKRVDEAGGRGWRGSSVRGRRAAGPGIFEAIQGGGGDGPAGNNLR